VHWPTPRDTTISSSVCAPPPAVSANSRMPAWVSRRAAPFPRKRDHLKLGFGRGSAVDKKGVNSCNDRSAYGLSSFRSSPHVQHSFPAPSRQRRRRPLRLPRRHHRPGPPARRPPPDPLPRLGL
jgi:hypothetical protein